MDQNNNQNTDVKNQNKEASKEEKNRDINKALSSLTEEQAKSILEMGF